MSSIGEILKINREFNNLTLKQLSDISGVGPSTISDIETGKAKNPRMDTLENLANALKIPVNTFFHNSKELNNDNKNKKTDYINNIEKFTEIDDAKQFILEHPSIQGYRGFNLNKLSEYDILALANDLLSYLKYLIFKYKIKR